jgi:hypothetical protein
MYFSYTLLTLLLKSLDMITPRVKPSPDCGDAFTPRVKPSPDRGDAFTSRVKPSPDRGDAFTSRVKPSPDRGDAFTPRVTISRHRRVHGYFDRYAPERLDEPDNMFADNGFRLFETSTCEWRDDKNSTIFFFLNSYTVS